jgi:hypothetical protein
MYTASEGLDRDPDVTIGDVGVPAIYDEAGRAATTTAGFLTPAIVDTTQIYADLRQTTTKSVSISVERARVPIHEVLHDRLALRMDVHSSLGLVPRPALMSDGPSGDCDLHVTTKHSE